MDGRRFDELARALAIDAPRRRLLAGLGGGALAALLGLGGAEEAEAKCVRPGRRCTTRNGKRRKCCGGAKCRGKKCKCPRREKECGKRCIPDGDCCRDGDCPDGTCQDGTCVPNCPGGQKPCGEDCIPAGDCCDDGDCLPDSTCGDDGVCRANDCPAIHNFCHGERRCGPGDGCFCITSFTDQTTVCSDAGRHECTNCASDAECTERLGEAAVCLFNGPACEGRCPGTSRLCVSAGCAPCPSGQRRCRTGECVTGDECCTDADCDGGAVCQDGTCRCPSGRRPCGDECIPVHDCCNDADCGSDNRCQDGRCVATSCPTTDVCNDNEFCGGPGDVCLCATSTAGTTVCSQAVMACLECSSDADCTAALGQAAICVGNGEDCPGCTETFCMVARCGNGAGAARAGDKPGKSPWKPLPKRRR